MTGPSGSAGPSSRWQRLARKPAQWKATSPTLSVVTSLLSRSDRPDDAGVQAAAGAAAAEAAAVVMSDTAGEHFPPTSLREDVPPDLTAAAFFDVDNTLIQGASIFHFARGLATHDYFSAKELLGFAIQQAKFRWSGKESSSDVDEARGAALAFIKGRPVEDLVRLGEEIFDEHLLSRIWPGTRALAQMHLDAGQQVWLVTATPVQLAQIIARRLGLTGALGTVPEVDAQGRFTGHLVGDILHGLGKAHAVRHLAIREGFDLRRCTAYSDSKNDVPMLSLVGTAVAVNPDSELREVARARGWDIRDYRNVRRFARVGLVGAAAAGAVGGAAAAFVGSQAPRWLDQKRKAAERKAKRALR